MHHKFYTQTARRLFFHHFKYFQISNVSQDRDREIKRKKNVQLLLSVGRTRHHGWNLLDSLWMQLKILSINIHQLFWHQRMIRLLFVFLIIERNLSVVMSIPWKLVKQTLPCVSSMINLNFLKASSFSFKSPNDVSKTRPLRPSVAIS